MRARPLIRANVRQTLVRFRAVLIALVVGVSMLLTSAALVGAGIAQDAHRLDSDSRLSTLELLSVSPAGSPHQLTPPAIDAIRSMVGVQTAVGGGSVGTSLSSSAPTDSPAGRAAEGAFGGVFWAIPRFDWRQPPVVRVEPGRSIASPLASGRVLLPDQLLGTDLGPLLGTDIAVEYTVRTGQQAGVPAQTTWHVAGLYDSRSPLREGESAVYVTQSDFDALFAAVLGAPGATVPADASFGSCWVKADSVASANRLAEELTGLGYYVNSGGGTDELPRALGLLQQANTVLAVVLALFGVGMGTTLAGTWSHLRRWDVGVLTSLGWSSRRILGALGQELGRIGVSLGVASVVLSCLTTGLGSLILRGQSAFGVTFPAGFTLPPWPWMACVLVGMPAALLVGGAPGILRLSRLEPDDALRRVD